MEGGERRPVSSLAGRSVRVLAAVGDPLALVRQLETLGALVEADIHPDHHEFTDVEIREFARRVPSDGLALCTLKDAVKLRARWPRDGAPLWYVSQHVIVERGVGGIERVLDDLARAHDTNRRERS
jgi:tetraacyldisaccharide-1-P 4'-kinase